MKTKESCLIVGGGPGLGLGIARKFGLQGFSVGVIAKRQEVLQTMGGELKGLGIDFLPLECDITNFEQLSASIDLFLRELGVPRVLIYNAAGFGAGDALSQTPEGLVNDFRVSVAAFIACYQKLFNVFSACGGTILVTGGGIAYQPSYEYLSLGIGKTSIDYVVASIAPEFAKHNIRVAILTIRGKVEENTYFSPDNIASAFWDLYTERDTSSYRRDYQR